MRSPLRVANHRFAPSPFADISSSADDRNVYEEPLLSQFELARKSPRCALTIALHLGLIIIYTVSGMAFVGHYTRREVFESEVPYSPARSAATYSNVIHSNWNGDPYEHRYKGGPNLEVDRAWEELLEPYNLRVSSTELERLNKTSLPLHDGSGEYWASMEVYHHLHCLNMMRHWMAREYYHENMQNEKMELHPGHAYPSHIEHCLDMLRQHLMCSPSLSFWTYSWREENNFQEPSDDMHFEHRCVDWKALHAWARDRSFDIGEGLIHRPNGTVYTGL